MVAVESTMLPLGTQAPPFALPDPAGHTWSLDDIAGARGTLVAFVCNHCPYVRHIAPRLGVVAAGWIEAGIGVVGINSNDATSYPDDRPDRMATQAVEWNWTFPYVTDEDQSVARAYRAACTPDFFLFDADRALVYRGRFDAARPSTAAPVTGDELDAAVRAVLAGAAVPAEQWPSIGCNIKWRAGNTPAWFG
ncbi:MAG TPA: thioredoxin family protein [Actinophytocola sp.]|uniref:thioredoxin family protein n=1 Tax=Actinophytocola sp. TaxID=1872138 RepID=UPI002DBFAFED|nr:thioredoxin family protein [Actinophytocola sp.]HEU5475352.1 thioredoxin family protein [Actinophytocola sp.]